MPLTFNLQECYVVDEVYLYVNTVTEIELDMVSLFTQGVCKTFESDLIRFVTATLIIGRLSLIQWNLDLTKCQGTGEIGSLYRGFVISRFISIHYTITGLKNIVRYTEDFVT